MSIENTHLPKVPDFAPQGPANSETPGLPPQGPANHETDMSDRGDSVPATPYELLGGVPGDAQASAKNFQYPNSVDPLSAWTPEQRAAYLEILKKDPTFRIDPNDTTFVERLTEEEAAVSDTHTDLPSQSSPTHAGWSRETKEQESFLQKHWKKLAAGALALGLLGGGAKVLADSNAEAMAKAEPSSTSQPSATAEGIVPTATTPATQEIVPMNPLCDTTQPYEYSIPVSVVECGLAEKFPIEQQIELKKYENMQMGAFQALPIDKQLQYADYIYRNNVSSATPYIKGVLESFKFTPFIGEVVPPSPTNTPQQIMDQDTVKRAMASGFLQYKSEKASSGYLVDTDASQKVISAFALYGTNDFNVMAKASQVGDLNKTIFKVMRVEDGNANTPVTGDKVTITARNANDPSDVEHIIKKLYTFETIEGTTGYQWVTVSVDNFVGQ